MKKYLVLAILALALTACGGSNDTSYSPTITFETDPAPVYTTAPAETAPPPEEVEEYVGVFDFMFNDTHIYMDQDIRAVIFALGEPYGVRQTPSCAFDGYDHIFGFGAVNIHTYPSGARDLVHIISLRNDNVTTREGIRIGATWDRVTDAYGHDFIQDFNMHTFTRGNTQLSFYVVEGIVHEITYSLILEDN